MIFILLSLLATTIWADTKDTYQFATDQQKVLFAKLTQEYRCLVCQNEALADSNATLANDLRNQIAQLVQQGASEPQITHYLVQRYGDYVLFRPPVTQMTYFLWFGPFVLLLLGLGWLFWSGCVRRKKFVVPVISEEQKNRLQQLLANEVKHL